MECGESLAVGITVYSSMRDDRRLSRSIGTGHLVFDVQYLCCALTLHVGSLPMAKANTPILERLRIQMRS